MTTSANHPAAEDLDYVEIRRPVRAADAELPDWVDLLACIAAPVLIALVVILIFRAGETLSAGG